MIYQLTKTSYATKTALGGGTFRDHWAKSLLTQKSPMHPTDQRTPVAHTAETYVVNQPVSGTVSVLSAGDREQTTVASTWHLISFGGTLLHIALGTIAGVFFFNVVKSAFPEPMQRVEDFILTPFNKRRRLNQRGSFDLFEEVQRYNQQNGTAVSWDANATSGGFDDEE